MITELDARREAARNYGDGRFGEQNLADPGRHFLTPQQTGFFMPSPAQVEPVPVIEPFDPAGRRRPLLWFGAKKRVRNQLQVDLEVLTERLRIVAIDQAQVARARTALACDDYDRRVSAQLLNKAWDRYLGSQAMVDESRRNIAEGQWLLGIDKEMAA